MNLKTVLGAVLVALVIVFTIQNLQIVTVQFLFWHLSLPRAVMIFVVFLIGALAGILLPRRRRHW